MAKRLTKLMLIGLLAFTGKNLAHDLDTPYKCTHDDNDQPEPEMQDIEEDFNPEGNDHSGRTLASYNGMRTYAHFSLTSSSKSYFQNDLIPPIMDYLQGALKVKYPVTGKWKTTASSVCSVSTPSILKSGVDADFVWVIVTDNSNSYVASSSTCTYASGSRRPLSGKTIISTNYFKATTDVLVHEKNMVCIMHEVTHILGFAKHMFSKFINANGKTLSGHVTTGTLGGASAVVLNVEPLTSMLREHYGCSSLKGAYMENSGSSGTYGSHFEKRHFGYEAMTSGVIHQQPYTKFTLALLEGSGWFVPDYSYADPTNWGQGQGCSFLTGSCSSINSQFDEFCTSSTRGCTNPGRGGSSSCSSDDRTDGCKFLRPTTSYDCDNSGAANNARLKSVEVYGRGKQSKCFTGTLSTSSSSASTTSFCFTFNCAGSGSNTVLTVNLGSKSVVCEKEGKMSVSGYKGTVNCPDPLAFCSTTGSKACPRNCMGRGTCVDGFCQCKNGFKGSDCALRSAF